MTLAPPGIGCRWTGSESLGRSTPTTPWFARMTKLFSNIAVALPGSRPKRPRFCDQFAFVAQGGDSHRNSR
jgi:hypothetical protein